jgi:dihydroneopterin aldolase
VTDHIRLNRLAVFARHGVLAEEIALGQRFFISIDAEVDCRPAGLSDDLRQSVSYAELADIAAGLASTRRFNLIEALAEAIAAAILDRLPRVDAVTVTVDKPSAPLPHVFDSAAVEIRRTRQHG